MKLKHVLNAKYRTESLKIIAFPPTMTEKGYYFRRCLRFLSEAQNGGPPMLLFSKFSKISKILGIYTAAGVRAGTFRARPVRTPSGL